MDRYAGSKEEETPRRDPSLDASGIEVQMWQLDLGNSSKSYPSRPDEADCIYYLRTGYCGYGVRCRFNHPPNRTSVLGAVEFPERVRQPLCQYYLRTGSCKFGASCKFHHPKQGISPAVPSVFNYHGYPLRPGVKECAYYMKTGQCKFSTTCKFDHPQLYGSPIPTPVAPSQFTPVSAQVVSSAIYTHEPSPSQQYPVVVPRGCVCPSYGPVTYGPVVLPPGVVPYPGWSPYQAITSPSNRPSSASMPVYGSMQHPQSVLAITAVQPSISSSVASSGFRQGLSLPERPGQPDCQHYLRTGYCKYGSACRFNHPSEIVAREDIVLLGLVGLPLLSGAPICSHYAQHGICRYGQACRFHHPMHVMPYPIGSSTGTLAPSSSSSELQIGSIIWRSDMKSSKSGNGSALAD